MRYWTEQERHELFQRYFDGSPIPCQVCAQALTFRMHHTREVVLLSVRCDNCGNSAILLFNGLIALPSEKVEHNF